MDVSLCCHSGHHVPELSSGRPVPGPAVIQPPEPEQSEPTGETHTHTDTDTDSWLEAFHRFNPVPFMSSVVQSGLS